jgi:hypothetical protein
LLERFNRKETKMKKSTEALKKADLSPAKSETAQTTRKSRTYLKTDDLVAYFRNEGKNTNRFKDGGTECVYRKCRQEYVLGKWADEESIIFIDDDTINWSGMLYLKREILEVKE